MEDGRVVGGCVVICLVGEDALRTPLVGTKEMV